MSVLPERTQPYYVRVSGEQVKWNLWLCTNGKLRSLTETVNTALSCDAKRHSQDLVSELIDQKLKECDRQRIRAPRRL
jgi:hypothetical protein